MSEEHNHGSEEAGILGQQYAFVELCPDCKQPLAHLVKVYNADNVQKGRWCTKCGHEVLWEKVIVENIEIADYDAPKKKRGLFRG